MAEAGVELLTSPLLAQQHVLVDLLGFWERRLKVDSEHIKGLKGLFPLLPDVLPADSFEDAIQCLAYALGEEIAQRQGALEKLQAAYKVISFEVMQRHPNGGNRTVFATDIDWLNQSEAHLSSEEAALDEDKRIAELALREPRPVVPRGGGILNFFRVIPGPGPPPSPQSYTIADLHFRHQVFAVNLERDELKASIMGRTSEWGTTLTKCVKAMKTMLMTFADAQVDLSVALSALGSKIRFSTPEDIATPRINSFTSSVGKAILRRLLPPHRYISFKYQELAAAPATHNIIFGCSIPESRPRTGSPQANAIDAFYYLLRQPYQPNTSATSDVSKIAHLFERDWSLSHNGERNDAPAPGMEWETATADLVLHFLRCLRTPLLPIPSRFRSRNFEDQDVVDDLMEEWGRGMERETPRTLLIGAIRRYTIPYLGARTEGHLMFLHNLAVALTHKSDTYRPVNHLLSHENIGELAWQWIRVV